ncbi:DUF3888 domain-containing protein [Sporosarcina luteola]|uniref:DUF3888 domain-containing protein n=1 Tax=Sporosarcina luteola TaxID=582850 RepID=UPI002041586A|nr:DUF3888 domain-containing protein [Sporosarcina luteola]MCM3711134.1 DUF3888 domain-containing protein [Sporosarcina luteola]
MRRPSILLVSITLLFLITTKVYSQDELTREKLLEETLLVRFDPTILEITDKLFMCERIIDIKRVDGDRKHEITIEVVTFEQAHSPPYDLFRITLIDTPSEINVINVKRARNLSTEQLNKHCGFKEGDM